MIFLSNTFNLFFLPIYYKGKYEKFQDDMYKD